jgi:hypothetical protein
LTRAETIDPGKGTGFLELLSEETEFCVRDFREEKKNGQIDLHFSQGALASVEVSENCDNCSPGHEVGAFAPQRSALFATRKVRWIMAQKKNGRVTLLFEQGMIAAVRFYVRLSPERKKGVDKLPESP